MRTQPEKKGGGGIGRSSFLKKGGGVPKARAKPLRRAEGGMVRKGGVYHTILCMLYISCTREKLKIKCP